MLLSFNGWATLLLGVNQNCCCGVGLPVNENRPPETGLSPTPILGLNKLASVFLPNKLPPGAALLSCPSKNLLINGGLISDPFKLKMDSEDFLLSLFYAAFGSKSPLPTLAGVEGLKRLIPTVGPNPLLNIYPIPLKNSGLDLSNDPLITDKGVLVVVPKMPKFGLSSSFLSLSLMASNL